MPGDNWGGGGSDREIGEWEAWGNKRNDKDARMMRELGAIINSGEGLHCYSICFSLYVVQNYGHSH